MYRLYTPTAITDVAYEWTCVVYVENGFIIFGTEESLTMYHIFSRRFAASLVSVMCNVIIVAKGISYFFVKLHVIMEMLLLLSSLL